MAEDKEETLVLESIIGKDGKKKIVIDEKDFNELLEIVAHYDELVKALEEAEHMEECEDEECEKCLAFASADEDDECCDDECEEEA